MLKGRLRLAVIAIVLGTGCSRVTTITHEVATKPVRHAPRPAIAALDQQVVNAVKAGEGDPVAADLRRKVTVSPDDVRARMDLASRYINLGFPELAIEHLRLAAARAPHLSEVRIQLAKALYEQGFEKQAIAELASFCNFEKLPPVELVSLLGIYEDETGLMAEAEKHFRQAIELAPMKDWAHNNLGYNLLLQGKTDAAIVAFRQAIAFNPRSESAHNNLGLALASTPDGDRIEALLHWQSVSDPATAHNNLASVMIDRKDYAGARKELEVALGYSRNHSAALRNLALLSELEGRPVEVRMPGPAPGRKTAKVRKSGAPITQPAVQPPSVTAEQR